MAKLYYRYGAMNSGKTTLLLQVAHNYEERGMQVLLMKPAKDSKGKNKVISRLGVEREVDLAILEEDDCRDLIKNILQERPIHCILIDEAQFLTEKQADQLYAIVLDWNIPVICYGLRTDFQGQGFPGSNRLLQLAHSLEELKNICSCGRKAVMNIRKYKGEVVFEGKQVAIDGMGDIDYEAYCGQCYFKERRKQNLAPLSSLKEDKTYE